MDIALFMHALERAKRDHDRLEAEIDAKQRELRMRDRVASALRGLRTCWSDDYAGKYGPHWFFVSDYELKRHDGGRTSIRYEKCWVTALIDDAAKARAKAETGRLALVNAAAAKHAACPHCGKDAPVVGRYEQTEDSWSGDTWELELSTLCLPCISLDRLGNDFRATYHY
jgi:hypothetical protein